MIEFEEYNIYILDVACSNKKPIEDDTLFEKGGKKTQEYIVGESEWETETERERERERERESVCVCE